MKKIVGQLYVYQICQGLGWLKPGVLVTLLSALALLVGQMAAQGTSGQRPRVLTTVAPLTNIVKNVGGPSIELRGLIPGGADSHTFEPAPSDIRYIAEADVIILNGLDLEGPTEKL